MNTVILTWNPALSDYKTEQFRDDFLTVVDGDTPQIAWPVGPDERCKDADRFFMIRQGMGSTGICMAGYFYSDAFEDDDWEGEGKRFKVSIDPLVMINTERGEHLSLKDLKTAIPTVNWEAITSGTVISEEEAGKLEDMWLAFLYKNITHTEDGHIAVSDDFDLEDFESIPASLQTYYKKNIRNTCERCGKSEQEVNELAFHFVWDDNDDTSTPLLKRLHCYCNECWFG